MAFSLFNLQQTFTAIGTEAQRKLDQQFGPSPSSFVPDPQVYGPPPPPPMAAPPPLPGPPTDAVSDGLGHYWNSATQSWYNDDGTPYVEQAAAPPLPTAAPGYYGEDFASQAPVAPPAYSLGGAALAPAEVFEDGSVSEPQWMASRPQFDAGYPLDTSQVVDWRGSANPWWAQPGNDGYAGSVPAPTPSPSGTPTPGGRALTSAGIEFTGRAQPPGYYGEDFAAQLPPAQQPWSAFDFTTGPGARAPQPPPLPEPFGPLGPGGRYAPKPSNWFGDAASSIGDVASATGDFFAAPFQNLASPPERQPDSGFLDALGETWQKPISYQALTGQPITDIPGLGWAENVPYLPETLDALASPASIGGGLGTLAEGGLSALLAGSGKTALATYGGTAGSDAAGRAAIALDAPAPIVTASQILGGVAGGIGGWQSPSIAKTAGTGVATALRELPENIARSVSPSPTFDERLLRGAVDPTTGQGFDLAPLIGGADEVPPHIRAELDALPPPESVQAGMAGRQTDAAFRADNPDALRQFQAEQAARFREAQEAALARGASPGEALDAGAAAMAGQRLSGPLEPLSEIHVSELKDIIGQGGVGGDLGPFDQLSARNALRTWNERGTMQPRDANMLHWALTGEKPPATEALLDGLVPPADVVIRGKKSLSDEVNRAISASRKPTLKTPPTDPALGVGGSSELPLTPRENLIGEPRQLPTDPGGRANTGDFEAPTRALPGFEAPPPVDQPMLVMGTNGGPEFMNRPIDLTPEQMAAVNARPGPSTPLGLIQQRDAALTEFAAADAVASEAERKAMGISKTDWMGDRATARNSRALSPEGVAREDQLWRDRLASAQDQSLATTAGTLRAEADAAKKRLLELSDQFKPEGVGPLAGAGPEMRENIHNLPTGYVDKEGNLILRGQTAADVELGVTPHMGKGRSVTAAIADDLTKQRQSTWQHIASVLNLPRAYKAAFDASATLRQSLPVGVANPAQWGKAFVAQVKAIRSEASFNEVMNAIHTSPTAGLKEKAGLFLASRSDGLNAREEAFLSTLAGKVPILGRLESASERGYIAMLDKLRSDVFDKVYEGWLKQGVIPSDADLKDLATFINHGTGRGTGKLLNTAGDAMSVGFFAPRYWASKPQMIWDVIGPGRAGGLSSTIARKEAARTVATWAASMATIGGLSYVGLAAAGKEPEVGWNPLSGKFGRVGAGGVTVDLTGGLATDIGGAARFAAGARADANGNLLDADRMGTLGRYTRGKLSPSAALAYDLLTGQDYNGNPSNLNSLGGAANTMNNAFGNLFLNDVWKEFKHEGGTEMFTNPAELATFLGAMLGSFFGANVRVDNSPYTKRDEEVQAVMGGKTYAELTTLEKARWDREHGKPEATSEMGKEFEAVREEASAQQEALESEFQSGEILTLGEYNDARKSNADRIRGRFEQIGGDLPEGTRDALTAYFDMWDEATLPSGAVDQEKFAELEADWNATYPTGQKDLQEYGLLRNTGPVEQERRAAMNQLANDGYFMGKANSIPRYIGMVSDLSEPEILDLQAEISRARKADPILGSMTFDEAVQIYLLKRDEDPLVIADVMHAGSKKYDNPEFVIYKIDHPELLAWLNPELDYETIQTIAGK